MVALSIVVGAIAAVLLLPAVSDLVSLLRLAIGRRATAPPPIPGHLPRLLFLVPAHDEELLVGDCVRSLLAQRYPNHALAVVVVADNCRDRTAECARRAGADTLERDEESLPGKPHAIAWALKRVALLEYEAVVIVDADTMVDPGFAAAVSRVPGLGARAAQAYFDVSNRGDSALTRMGAVLATGNHRFAYRLKRSAGLNVPLVGNGMVLGAPLLAVRGWTAFSITEDWELYAKLTAAGVEIEGLCGARLYSQEARSLSQSATQRQRWTAGRLSVLARQAGPLLASRRIGPRQKLDALAELSAPGPGLHLGIAVALASLCAGLAVPGWPGLIGLLGVGLARPLIYAVAALLVDPEPRHAAGAFLHLPAYAVWRLGTAARALALLRRDSPWVRTERHVPKQ